jgi:hypothetical protein
MNLSPKLCLCLGCRPNIYNMLHVICICSIRRCMCIMRDVCVSYVDVCVSYVDVCISKVDVCVSYVDVCKIHVNVYYTSICSNIAYTI